MSKKLMRVLVLVLALALFAGLLAGCSQTKDPGDEENPGGGQQAGSGGTAQKDTLIIATANETPSVTTHLHNAVAGDYLNKMTHNGLFYYDDNLTPQPDLCESYTLISDTVWEFKIKQGVKFHNGAELKAADVKASLELCKESPEVAQYGRSTGTIEVVDDYTVRITTDGPQSGLLADLCHHGSAILPADLIESGHDFNKEPIGTGPYMLTAWNKGENLEFEAFRVLFPV